MSHTSWILYPYREEVSGDKDKEEEEEEEIGEARVVPLPQSPVFNSIVVSPAVTIG